MWKSDKMLNEHELILSSFSKNFFFRTMVYDDLHFKDDDKHERELSDLILLIDKSIICIQMKSYNSSESKSSFEKWFNRNIKNKANKQHKDTKSNLYSLQEIKFTNNCARDLILKPGDIDNIVYITIFDYPKEVGYDRYHTSDTLGEYNIFSTKDFQLMCNSLLSPNELRQYLNFRIQFDKRTKGKLIALCDWNDMTALIKPGEESSIIDGYIFKEYPNIDDISYDCQIFKNMINGILTPQIYEKFPFEFLFSFSRIDMHNLVDIFKRVERGEIILRKRAYYKHGILIFNGNIINNDDETRYYMKEMLNDGEFEDLTLIKICPLNDLSESPSYEFSYVDVNDLNEKSV